nr:HAMP domain-containing sensor histidine kinase [Ancylomarina subtilis]
MRALNSTKDKFFSIIAHDLRNPFNALITLSSFLVDAIDSNDKEEAKELASIIETSSKQGFELLVNLLEWSRTQTGAIKYNPNLINLNRELKNPIQIIESIAESKQIRFKHDINKNITAFADPNMIRTIVRNLLSNAVKFTPRVGIISIEANENETEIVIKIRDNGVGMSQEIIDDLFTIDVNTSAQGTEGETGTGLGLILCFEFVKKHKGRIWVESEKGKGSCFSFSIPKETTKP